MRWHDTLQSGILCQILSNMKISLQFANPMILSREEMYPDEPDEEPVT